MSKINLDLQHKSIEFCRKTVSEFMNGLDEKTAGYAVKVSIVSGALSHGFYKGFEYCEKNDAVLSDEGALFVSASEAKQYIALFPGAKGQDRESVIAAFEKGFIGGARDYRESRIQT